MSVCSGVDVPVYTYMWVFCFLSVSATVCVYIRGQGSSSGLPSPPSAHAQHPSATAKPAFLYDVYIPNCTAEYGSTHNTPGNDAFAMATTNKGKFRWSEWGRKILRERVGRKSTVPSVLAAPAPWQRALTIRFKKISLLLDVAVYRLPSFRCPPTEMLSGQSSLKHIWKLSLPLQENGC